MAAAFIMSVSLQNNCRAQFWRNSIVGWALRLPSRRAWAARLRRVALQFMLLAAAPGFAAVGTNKNYFYDSTGLSALIEKIK